MASALHVAASLHSPSRGPAGAEAAPAAAATAPAAELRAALRDVVAAQRAQQASAEPARPAARPRLRNSRCAAGAAGAAAATASEPGVLCSASCSMDSICRPVRTWRGRSGAAAPAWQLAPSNTCHHSAWLAGTHGATSAASRSRLRRGSSVRVVRRRPRLLFQPRPLAEAAPLDLDAEEVATCLEALCAVRVP